MGHEPLKLGYKDDELESDLEGEVNRVGDIDLSLYADEEHVGYDVLGRKVSRTLPRESAIDNFLRQTSDDWRVILDQKNQTTYRLTDRDLEIIKRVREGRLGVSELNDDDFFVEFEHKDSHLPLRVHTTRKAAYTPGAEETTIRRLVKLIREGTFQPRKPRVKPEFNDLWGSNILAGYDKHGQIIRPVMPAPKPPLPTHAESYNPSPEYLLTEEEAAAWAEQHEDDRLHNFLPQKHDSLRRVGGYANIYKEAFSRCLDLYLCPRSLRHDWIENSSDLLPKIPSLDHFKPFPRTAGIVVKDHGSDVMALQFDRGVLAAGYRDGSLAIHNIASHPFYLPEFYARTHSKGTAYAVQTLSYHPKHPLLVFSRAQYLYILLVRRPQTSYLELRHLVHRYWGNNETLGALPPHLEQYAEAIDAMRASKSEVPLCAEDNRPARVGVWRAFRSSTYFRDFAEPDDEALGDDEGSVETSGEEDEDTGHDALLDKDWAETLKFVRLLSDHNKYIVAGFVISLGVKPTSVSVHPKGAYVATAAPQAPTPSSQCLLHHLKKKRSLAPLRKVTGQGIVEAVAFHPTKPHLIVGFPKTISIYDLQPQRQVHIAATEGEKNRMMAQIIQKFRGTEYATAMEVVHDHKEDNTHLLRVSVDGKFQWYDCDYGSSPYRTIEVVENGSVVSVKHHSTLPLVAAGTSKSHIQLFHAAQDDLTEIQIQPLVRLSDKESHVTALAWNPQNHWLASGHSNGRIIVWV